MIIKREFKGFNGNSKEVFCPINETDWIPALLGIMSIQELSYGVIAGKESPSLDKEDYHNSLKMFVDFSDILGVTNDVIAEAIKHRDIYTEVRNSIEQYHSKDPHQSFRYLVWLCSVLGDLPSIRYIFYKIEDHWIDSMGQDGIGQMWEVLFAVEEILNPSVPVTLTIFNNLKRKM